MDQKRVLMIIAIVALAGAAFLHQQATKSGDKTKKQHAMIAAAVAGIAGLLYFQMPASAQAPLLASQYVVPL